MKTDREILEEGNGDFGVCPKCGNTDGYLNVNRNHYNVCNSCKNYWPVGSNLFSGWRDEDEETWEKNARLLDSFTEVKPYYPGEQHT